MNRITTLSCATSALLFSFTALMGQTPQQVTNAVAFTKLYGYVKYFHPSDEAASIDWNRFAIYGSQKVSGCKNGEELQKTLVALFKPIAPALQLFKEGDRVSFDKAAVMVENSSVYQTIAWQHRGVGLGARGDVYKSARTNRPIVTPSSEAQAAPLSSWLDAAPLQGKEFILKGKVRLTEGDGQGQLWVRVDRDNKTMGFFDNMNDRPVKDNQWKEYEIKGTIDKDAARVFFGVMLIGKGAIECKDLSLQVKGEDGWKEWYRSTFEGDESGSAPASLSFSNALLKTYAIKVQKEEGKGAYLLVKSQEAEPNREKHNPLFDRYPQVGEYLQRKIGGGLEVILPLALYGTDAQTFPAGDPALLLALKENLKVITARDITGANLYTRLGDLAITWTIFQHFFPYFDVAKTDWNNALAVALAKAYRDKTSDDFQKTLQQLTAKLKDGHVRVSNSNKMLYLPSVWWEWVENQLVVTHVGDSTIPLKRGDLVKEIDGQTPEQYFAAVDSNISAATKGWLNYRAQTESLMGERGSVIKLKVQKADHTVTEVALTRNTGISQYYASFPAKDMIKALPNNMMYVNIDKASMEDIDKVLPQLKKSKVIICDLRGYPNGNHGFIEYLLKEKDTSTQWMQVPQIIYPDQENIAGYSKHGWSMKPSKTHLDARIIFLVDGQAISYAESYMSFIEHYKLATIIGQPTAGTNGNINPFTLPGGYYISWTGMKVQKHNGTPHHGVGIIPDITVQKTIKGVREGRDEFLDKAIEVGGSKTF